MYLWNEYERNDLKNIKVSYEDLVSNPAEEVGKILEFLETPWDDNVLHHHKTHRGLKIGYTDASRKIDSESIHKWQKTLTGDEIKRLRETADFLENITVTKGG